ncbi:MAG: GTP-binding protein, partial [Firmicutes bacterium]|nr:GTP-binding protein [Bacillota bacterium]
NLTVNMDYPDEDIEEITYKNIEDSLSAINDKLLKLLASADEGRIIREGFSIAIIGKPNVGKSSLMNIFMGEERSIVTDIPGTTRDIIEESAQINGIAVRLIDTAGIHESSDTVEKIGIEKSKDAFESARLVLLILDSSRPLSSEDRELIKASEGTDTIIVLNKTDLEPLVSEKDLDTALPVIRASFMNGTGLDDIKKAIEERVTGSSSESRDDAMLSNIRHINLAKKASSEVRQALEMTKGGEAIDFIEVNAKAAFDYLGEITGDTASGEIIDEIYSRFCLGK